MVGLGLMKNIDVKSLIIGALLTSTIFLGVAATSPTDKWDIHQVWEIYSFQKSDKKLQLIKNGYVPFAVTIGSVDGKTTVHTRRRTK